MDLRPHLLFACFATTALTGCKDKASPPDATTRPVASASASAAARPTVPQDARHALALADPHGSNPVDLLIAKYETLLQTNPGQLDAMTLLGRAWIRKARETLDPGFYTDADACADIILDADPKNKLARGLKSQVFLNQHEFEKAKDLSDQVLLDDPTDLVALGVLSDALLELGRYDESTTAAQKMIDTKPNLASYVRGSYLRWIRGDVNGAIEAAKQAMSSGMDSRDPEPLAWATTQAAVIFWHLGDYPGADAGFNRALDGFTEYPPALVGKGRVALAKDDAKQAVTLLEKAYFLSPLVTTAWNLGDARAAAGDDAGAKAAYDLVVKRGRTSDPRTLALFYATKNRDLDEARTLIDDEHKKRPDIYTEDTLSWVLYRQGKFADAKAASERANHLKTPDALLQFHHGAIRVAVGEKKDGQKEIRDALKRNPKFDPSSVELANDLLK